MNRLPAEGAFTLAADHVVAGDDLELLSPGYVQMRDGVVTGIGKGEPPLGDRVLRLPEQILIPGLINCHTHIGDAAVKELGYGVPSDVNLLWQPDGLRHVRMNGLPREERVTAIRRALRHALSTGTVAVADFREGGVDGVAELREATEGIPITCIAFARFTQYPLHDEDALKSNQVGLSEEQLAELDVGLSVAEGFSPLWANDTTDRGLAQIAEASRRQGKLLATHAGETPMYREISSARTGSGDVERTIRHLSPDFIVHMTAATDAELDEVAAAALPIVMCARTQAALGYGVPPFVRARKRGVIVGLGSDNAMISSPDLLAELEFVSRAARSAAGDPAAVGARDLLAAVTIDAARILNLEDSLGSIAVGKKASLVVIDLGSDNLAGTLDPIAGVVDRATARDVRAVLVEGRLAYGDLPLESVDGEGAGRR